MKTIIIKHPYNGWQAKTTLDYSDNQLIEITTQKHSSGRISSHVSVYTDNGNGSKSHAIYADYSKTLRCTECKVTATEMSVTNYHKDSLKFIDSIQNQIADFYNIPLTNGIRVTA